MGSGYKDIRINKFELNASYYTFCVGFIERKKISMNS